MSQWSTPLVVVALSANMPAKGQHACSEALKWWLSKGVDYLRLQVTGDRALTPGMPWPGTIQVLSSEPPDGSSGFTQVHHSALGLIDAAEMRVSCHWYRAQTFAHEFGHALGLVHTTQRENLMFPETSPGRSGLTPEQLALVRPAL